MLSTGQMLAAIRTLEIKVGSTLYQMRKAADNDQIATLALRVMPEIQKELERLGEN